MTSDIKCLHLIHLLNILQLNQKIFTTSFKTKLQCSREKFRQKSIASRAESCMKLSSTMDKCIISRKSRNSYRCLKKMHEIIGKVPKNWNGGASDMQVPCSKHLNVGKVVIDATFCKKLYENIGKVEEVRTSKRQSDKYRGKMLRKSEN